MLRLQKSTDLKCYFLFVGISLIIHFIVPMSDARVVVTGFGPFADIIENSSTIGALNLKYKWEDIRSNIPNPTELIVVPNVEVSYASAKKVVCKIWNEIKPVCDGIIH